jgi:hypothetical protein
VGDRLERWASAELASRSKALLEDRNPPHPPRPPAPARTPQITNHGRIQWPGPEPTAPSLRRHQIEKPSPTLKTAARQERSTKNPRRQPGEAGAIDISSDDDGAIPPPTVATTSLRLNSRMLAQDVDAPEDDATAKWVHDTANANKNTNTPESAHYFVPRRFPQIPDGSHEATREKVEQKANEDRAKSGRWLAHKAWHDRLTHEGRGEDLLAMGDVEANPGPSTEDLAGETWNAEWATDGPPLDVFEWIVQTAALITHGPNGSGPWLLYLRTLRCLLCDEPQGPITATNPAVLWQHWLETHTPREPRSLGRGGDILADGDIESNPGPPKAHTAPSRPSWQEALDDDSVTWIFDWHTGTMTDVDDGPSGGPRTRAHNVFDVRCNQCGWRIILINPTTMRSHYDRHFPPPPPPPRSPRLGPTHPPPPP